MSEGLLHNTNRSIIEFGGLPRLAIAGQQFQDLLCRRFFPRSGGEGLVSFQSKESSCIQNVAHRAVNRSCRAALSQRQLQGNPRGARALLPLSAVTEWQPLIAWAINQDVVRESSARFVLVCLAHHANQDGTNAFPSVATMVKYTGLSERTVRGALRLLESSGLIRRGRPTEKIRSDRRPVCYDLQIGRGAAIAPRESTGCNQRPDGVQLTHSRGAAIAPDLPSESSIENKTRARVIPTDSRGEPNPEASDEKRKAFRQQLRTLARMPLSKRGST